MKGETRHKKDKSDAMRCLDTYERRVGNNGVTRIVDRIKNY